MGLVSRLFGFEAAKAQRALDAGDVFGDDWAPSWDSVMSVAGEKALQLVPVYAATGLIADMYSSLPVDFYRKDAGVRREAEPPLWWGRPDRRVSLYDWKHQMLASILLRGNAIGLMTGAGETGQVSWLHPDKVVVDETGPTPVYRLGGDSFPHMQRSQGGDIVHVRGYVQPGSVMGLSPVGNFRRQLEMSRSALMTGHDFYENRAVPAGILKNEVATLSPEASDEAKARFKSAMKSGEPLALDKNWSWESVSLSPADAAFLETINASANQIAAMYRVEPEDVGGTATSSLKYTTVEGNQRKFNNRTLMPWSIRVEHAFDESVLGPGVYMKHNLDALARPNLLELNRSITEELRNGTLTLAEARALRDREPLTDEQVEQWQLWYATTKSENESSSTSNSTSTTVLPEGD